MKVSFAPLVVLFVSTALVDAIAEKPGQRSSSPAMEKSASEMNVKEADASKDFEVKSEKYRPEHAEPAPVLAELNADEKADSVEHIKAVDDNKNVDNIKSDDDDEKDDDNEKLGNVKSDDDEKVVNVKPDDDEKDDDDEIDYDEKDDDNEKLGNFKSDDEKVVNVKPDDDEKDGDDEIDYDEKDDDNEKLGNFKSDDDEKDDDDENFEDITAPDDEKDIKNTETADDELKNQLEESVISPDDEETTRNYFVSTVYTTITSTVTDCESTVTVCPEFGSVVTKTISLYTTICPETTSMPNVPLITAPAVPDTSKVSYLTKTVETTLWYTVTECPPQQADCVVGVEKSSVATYLDVQKVTYENTHTVNEDDSYPTTTFSKPYVTGYPSGKIPASKSNVTMPVVPINPTYDGASAKNFDGFAMYLGLAVAASATLFLQGWY